MNNNNNRKILINNYNPNSDINSRNIFFPNLNNNNVRNNTNNNFSPSHKTHVEIITKNGSKKPNIIVNNYDPDFNLNVRNDLSEMNSHIQNQKSASSIYLDRKSTCMLYLQADHTFFQKMGSDEASIETITRHVQRANSIYKNTGEL